MEKRILTEQLMTEIIRERALKICQLSLEITTRRLAQARAEVHGRINTFSAEVRPIDAPISGDSPLLAELRMELDHYDFYSPKEQEQDFSRRLKEADQYIAYLNLILARGTAMTMEAVRGAA